MLASFIGFLLLCVLLDSAAPPFPDCNGKLSGGSDRVTKLTGYAQGGKHNNPKLPVMYSGFVQVNSTSNGSLFYWLVEAQQPTKTTPLLIWLNGGPGASSLMGLFAENGPFRIDSSDLSLEYFNHTWSRYYHMLFIDNPVDTGFSFCNKGGWVTDEDWMGRNFLTLMTQFYKCHPELDKNPLYITGESYAGRYIPFVWKHMHASLDIAGLAIGNGIWDPFIQFYSSPLYAYTNGIISHEQFETANETVYSCLELAKSGTEPFDIDTLNEAANICLQVTNDVYASMGGNILQYDIRELNASFFDGLTDDIAAYLAQTSVSGDIHTHGIPWKSGDGTSAPNPVSDALNHDIVLNNSADIIPYVLESKTRILFYNGQFDGSVCNNYGNQQCLLQLNYQGNWDELQRTPWSFGGLTKGYLKKSGDGLLSYFVVSDSGHLVPYNQPETILNVIHEWVEEKL